MTTAPALEARARRLNGLVSPGREEKTWQRRLLTSGWTWAFVGLTIVYAAGLALLWFQMTADRQVEGGVIQGVNPSAIRTSAWYATSTLVFWVVAFALVDRFRPQRWVVWFLALGWGAAVATTVSSYANTWAAEQMAVTGNFDPATSARAAVFIAPFVEEAAKATVLFGLAILARQRLMSVTSLISLGGLSAAGFAFTENIIYYSRAIVYSSQTIEVGDAQAAVRELVWLRGFWTAFGHPLFTILTATGVAIALRTRSKVVRVLAPLVGYLAAALLHMVFNSQATFTGSSQQAQLLIYWLVAVPLVISATIYVIRQLLAQGKLIRHRLGDVVMMGWLEPEDPRVFSRVRGRAWALLVAATRGWTTLLATWQLQHAVTELAYLRESEVRGLVDEAGAGRARELLDSVATLRRSGIADATGMRPNLPRIRWPWLKGRRQAGLPHRSDDLAPATVGSPGYSAVDPAWGPPQG